MTRKNIEKLFKKSPGSGSKADGATKNLCTQGEKILNTFFESGGTRIILMVSPVVPLDDLDLSRYQNVCVRVAYGAWNVQ